MTDAVSRCTMSTFATSTYAAMIPPDTVAMPDTITTSSSDIVISGRNGRIVNGDSV